MHAAPRTSSRALHALPKPIRGPRSARLAAAALFASRLAFFPPLHLGRLFFFSCWAALFDFVFSISALFDLWIFCPFPSFFTSSTSLHCPTLDPRLSFLPWPARCLRSAQASWPFLSPCGSTESVSTPCPANSRQRLHDWQPSLQTSSCPPPSQSRSCSR